MYNLNWSRSDLTRQKLGTFCEYYAKMSLASYGMSIYTSEVDDHGIDFIAESKRGFLKFQVKAIRKGTGYVFMREEYFDISDQSLYLFLLLLNDGEHPIEYLILRPHGIMTVVIFLFTIHTRVKSRNQNMA